MTTLTAVAGPSLELDGASVDFVSSAQTTSAVHDVSFTVQKGEIFGLVGESGCGKSTLAMMLMGLLPLNARVGGSVRFEGTDVTNLAEDQWRRIRGDRMSLISQDPRSALDPVTPVGHQVAETIRAHRQVSRREARTLAVQALAQTGITHAADRYGDPPHRFSGGMCQRVVIATALANAPDLLIADEPTTALDVTIQAQILSLLKGLRSSLNMTILLITHDMGVVAQMCDRVGVMYAGSLVEVGDVDKIFARPAHPYTEALLGAIPTSRRHSGPLKVIPGQVPDLSDPPTGCRFKDRCDYRMPICETPPPLEEVGSAHAAACWLRGALRRETPAAAGAARRRGPVVGAPCGDSHRPFATGRARQQDVREQRSPVVARREGGGRCLLHCGQGRGRGDRRGDGLG
jgi:peptide/nickel transport system ATP-binding protein